MKSSDKRIKYLLIIVYGLIGVKFLISVFDFLVRAFNLSIYEYNDKSVFITLLMIAFLSMWCSIPFIIFSIRDNVKELKKDKECIEKFDFKKLKEYYKTVIENNSAAELNFINDFKNDDVQDAATTLLSLEYKKKIKIENGKIERLEGTIDYYYHQLKKSEEYILNKIENGRLFLETSNPLFRAYSIEESLSDGWMSINNEKNNKKSIFSMILQTVIMIILIICALLFFSFRIDLGIINANLTFITTFLVFFVSTAFILSYVVYFASYIAKFKVLYRNSLIRTRDGEDLKNNIENLRLYFKNFDKLDQEKQDDLKAWDGYNMFSVLFGFNKEKIKEVYEVMDITFYENKM